MTIGIAGASGLIGYNLFNFLSRKEKVIGTCLSHKKNGLVNFDLLSGDFSLFDPCDWVVVAAAVVKIDDCLKDRELARRINVEKTSEFISYLASRKIKVVFLSSDQVFDGAKGNYSETDPPAPVNLYGKLKRETEQFIEGNIRDYLILRLSQTYSRNLEEKSIYSDVYSNLKDKRPVKAAFNRIFNPTDVIDLSGWIYAALKKNIAGLYHLACPKTMSRYDFALWVAEENRLDKRLIEKIDFLSLPCEEKRALNSSLNVGKISKILGPLDES